MLRSFSCLLLLATSMAFADNPTTQPNRPEVLTVSGIITCPADKIWKCFTTGEGLVQAWGVKIAKVDFRLGGMIRTSYDPKIDLDSDNAIGNQILAYEPNRLLIIRPIAPAGAPDEIKEICKVGWNAIYLDPVAPDRTRVTVAGMGFAHTPLLDKAYEFFKFGNKHTIQYMQKTLGDPDADAKVRKAFDLLKSLEGEWMCESAADDPVFRACAVWKLEMNGCLLRMHNWTGDASAMRTENDMQCYIDPQTGGLAYQVFFSDCGVARGHIRLLDDQHLAADWTLNNGTEEPVRAYKEIKVMDGTHYTLSTWHNAVERPSTPADMVLNYHKVKEALPQHKQVKPR